jgi:hypothetical protein
MGAMALHGYSSMELKSRSFTSKEPHVAREPQVADPCSRPTSLLALVKLDLFSFMVYIYIASNNWMILNNEFEMVVKEDAV